MAMKINKMLYLALAGSMFVFNACEDDELVKGSNLKNFEGEIVFGGRAGFEMDKNESTRTIYTGDFYHNSDKTKKYEKVHWVKGDMVRIYCEECAESAGGLTTDDYVVTASNTGVDGSETENYHDTQLLKLNEEIPSLQWGDPTKKHTFYAVYPSPLQHNEDASDVVLNGTEPTKVSGYIPDIQTPNAITYNPATKAWVATPDMSYAYMLAKTSVVPQETNGVVSLQFMPIVTAVEITLKHLAVDNEGEPYDFSLANVMVSSSDKSPIYGNFSVDLKDMVVNETIGYAESIPTVTNSSADSTNYLITIPLYNNVNKATGENSNTTNGPALFQKDETFTFTVFMLNNTNLNSLDVTIQGVQGTKTGTISGSAFEIKKNLKSYIRNFPLTNAILPFNQSNWIKFLEDNAIVRTLSIPGAGGAASAELTAGGTTTIDGQTIEYDMIRQQDLTIEELWDKGVRCFEFAVNINGTATTTSLGGSSLICGGVTLNSKLEDAVNDVIAQLDENKDEFAMVILTYESAGGFGDLSSTTRNPATFMAQLNNYWETVSGQCEAKGLRTELYNPTTATVGASRGSLFCIARPTSIHEDYGTVLQSGYGSSSRATKTMPTISNYNADILTIHGWGSLKDKWQQRGYSDYSWRGTLTYLEAQDFNYYSSANDGLRGRPFDVSSMTCSKTTNTSGTLWKGLYWSGNLPSPSNYIVNVDELSENVDFHYDTKPGTGTAVTDGAWVQEWARVSNFGTTNDDVLQYNYVEEYHEEVKIGSWVISEAYTSATANSYYWANTYDEKVQRVKECLNYAINKEKGDIVYINSLCGYFITQDYDNSLTPCRITDRNIKDNSNLTGSSAVSGIGGDIAGFASAINQEFYNYIMTIGDKNGYQAGSMGIILMDKVSNDLSSVGSKIPGIIVANNFQTSQLVQTADAASIPTVNDTDQTPAYDPENDTRTLKASGEKADGEMTITWK